MGSPATTCTSSIARCRDTIPLSGGGTSPLVSYVETQARRSPRAPREGTQNQTELARRCRTGNSPCPTATCEPSTPRPTGATVTQPIPTHQPKPQYNTLIAKPPTKHLTKFPLRWFTGGLGHLEHPGGGGAVARHHPRLVDDDQAPGLVGGAAGAGGDRGVDGAPDVVQGQEGADGFQLVGQVPQRPDHQVSVGAGGGGPVEEVFERP